MTIFGDAARSKFFAVVFFVFFFLIADRDLIVGGLERDSFFFFFFITNTRETRSNEQQAPFFFFDLTVFPTSTNDDALPLLSCLNTTPSFFFLLVFLSLAEEREREGRSCVAVSSSTTRSQSENQEPMKNRHVSRAEARTNDQRLSEERREFGQHENQRTIPEDQTIATTFSCWQLVLFSIVCLSLSFLSFSDLLLFISSKDLMSSFLSGFPFLSIANLFLILFIFNSFSVSFSCLLFSSPPLQTTTQKKTQTEKGAFQSSTRFSASKITNHQKLI